MSTEAIAGMIVCLVITLGGFLYFLNKALKVEKKGKSEKA
jgi:hypothetical protein